ncbi:hypothetical protein [Caballeronia insecticola]|uniref:Uncharacterized protein n=1 Tax=Caballeronia insecticola TaxID=758793 RepID=R4WKD9_9BURK|nr:hypothetical protein [Caballeronia insecticola]BAN24914.1 hypothetical protein BRPE64_BCDS02530 [Caballeronia insecticola]
MPDALAGALCVFAALSAGAPTRTRAVWQAGAAVVAACLLGGASIDAAILLAACAGVLFVRPMRTASGVAASMQSLLVTLAFIAWLLPDALRSNGVLAVFAGGAVAACLCFADVRFKGTVPQQQSALHLAAAGACAALAYGLGAAPGALAVLAVIAMVALIGAHLSLALGGAAAAPVASILSGAAACGLALTAASDGALVVACIALAIGCVQSSPFARLVRQAP